MFTPIFSWQASECNVMSIKISRHIRFCIISRNLLLRPEEGQNVDRQRYSLYIFIESGWWRYFLNGFQYNLEEEHCQFTFWFIKVIKTYTTNYIHNFPPRKVIAETIIDGDSKKCMKMSSPTALDFKLSVEIRICYVIGSVLNNLCL